MYGVILSIHVIVCILVILIVLLQAGRSGGFSGLMGGGGGDALFSTSSQQSGLRKATVALAALFMATSFFLTILSSRRSGRSVFSSMPAATLPRQALPPVQSGEPAGKAADPHAGHDHGPGEGHTAPADQKRSK
jgi:preprotein translocase subunit SecG